MDTLQHELADFVKSLSSQDLQFPIFFSQNHLKQVVAKASTSTFDKLKHTALSKENVQRLSRLALYHVVFYCDDSGSMGRNDRFQTQKELVIHMARIATMAIPLDDKVGLVFIHKEVVQGNLCVDEVVEVLNDAEPQYEVDTGTQIGANLRDKILAPYVYNDDKSELDEITANSEKRLSKPLMVCIITDGGTGEEDASILRKEIDECKNTLVDKGYGPSSVVFYIGIVGDDTKAAKFLEKLGDDSINDVSHYTTGRLGQKYKDLRDDHDKLNEWLLKILSEPIM